MPDPNVPRNLADAITLVGTCQDMCPEYERVRRVVQRDVWYHESKEGDRSTTRYNRKPDEAHMVKRFARSAAGQEEQLPSDLRPPSVLKMTLSYLMTIVGGKAHKLGDVHHFIWDRTRAIRNDFSIQQVSKPEDVMIAIECFERIARFHIVSLHQLAQTERPYDEYDPQQEQEQLDKTLLSLVQYYTDHKGRVPLTNEAEFRAYQIVLQIQKPFPNLEERIECWGDDIIHDARVQQAIKIYRAASSFREAQGPFKQTAPHRIARSDWVDVWKIIDSPETPYLLACVAELYFPLLRHRAVEAIWHNWKLRPRMSSIEWSISDVQVVLGFESNETTLEYLEEHGFSTKEVYADNGYEKMLDLASVKNLSSRNLRQRCSGLVEQKRFSRNLAAVVDNFMIWFAWKAGMTNVSFVPGFERFNVSPLATDSRSPDLESFEYGFYTHEDKDSLFVTKRKIDSFFLAIKASDRANSRSARQKAEDNPAASVSLPQSTQRFATPQTPHTDQIQAAKTIADTDDHLLKAAEHARTKEREMKEREREQQRKIEEAERVAKEQLARREREARLAKEAQQRVEEERRRQAAIEAERAAAMAAALEQRRKAESKQVEEERRKDQLMEQLARRLVLDQGGLLEQFVEHNYSSMIANIQETVVQEVDDGVAKDFRRRKLEERYGMRWKDTAWKRRLARVGKQRRRRNREAEQKRSESARRTTAAGGEELRKEWDQFRSSREKAREVRKLPASALPQHHSTATNNNHGGTTPAIKVSRRPNAPSSSMAANGHNYSSKNIVSEETRKPFDGLSYSEYIRQRTANANRKQPVDQTRSTYFRQKALGLTPTPARSSPLSASTVTRRPSITSSADNNAPTSPVRRQKRPRNSVSPPLTIQANGFLGLRNSSHDSIRATDPSTTTMPPPPPRKTLRVSDEPESAATSLLSAKTSPTNETALTTAQKFDDLLASISQASNAITESTQWFREANEQESRSQSRRASIQDSNLSPASLQWAGHPADARSASRDDRRLSDDYLDGFHNGVRVAALNAASGSVRPQSQDSAYFDSSTIPSRAPLKYRNRVSNFLPRDMYADAQRERGRSESASVAGTPGREIPTPVFSPPDQKQHKRLASNSQLTTQSSPPPNQPQHVASPVRTVPVTGEHESKRVVSSASANRFAVFADDDGDVESDAGEQDEESWDDASDSNGYSDVELEEAEEGDYYENDEEEGEEEEQSAPPVTVNAKSGTSVEDAIEL